MHGYAWFDREAGLIRRFDVPEDIAHVENQLRAASREPPLLAIAGAAGYFLTFLGGAARALFTLANGMRPSKGWRTPRHALALVRATLRAPGELVRALADAVRFAFRERTMAFEGTWLAMRVLYATYFEELSLSAALADLAAGAPIVYLDFVAYDEAAHRRGPDHPVAYAQLRRIDRRIRTLHEAARARGYDTVVLSDHGQAPAVPFDRVDPEGRTLGGLVFEQCATSPRADRRIRRLAARLDAARVRAARVRKWPGVLRELLETHARVVARRTARRIEHDYGVPAGDLSVVTGGSIAHVYVGRRPGGATLEEIEARFPRLVPALVASPGIGLVVARRAASGPLVLWRDRRAPLEDPRALASLPPLAEIGPELAAEVIRRVLAVDTAGDLVVYGAFSPAGNVTFDPELGSHGGIHPEELDLFVLMPEGLFRPADGRFDPAALHAILRERYLPHA